MKKAIVKVKVEKIAVLEKRVKEMDLKILPALWQHDRVYVPRNFRRGQNLPRLVVRTEMKSVGKTPKYWLVLKRHIEDSGLEITDRTEIKDYPEMVNIILQLGFELKKEVSRHRREIVIGQAVKMYLDKIDGLEDQYVKIEAELEEGEEISENLEDLNKTLKIFNLSPKKVLTKPYFEMIRAEKSHGGK